MNTRVFALAICAIGGLASISHAQEEGVPLPGFMSDIPDLTFVGEVSGMKIFLSPSQDLTWYVPAGGEVALTGEMFSAAGRDIGAALTGSTPITIFEIGGSKPAVALTPAQPAPVASVEVEADEVAAVKSSDMASLNVEMENSRRTMDGLPDDEKRKLLISLTENLKEAQSIEAYAEAIHQWQSDIDAAQKEHGAQSDESEMVIIAENALNDIVAGVEAFERKAQEELEVASIVTPVADPAAAQSRAAEMGYEEAGSVDLSSDEMTDVSAKRDAVYEDMQNGFWFSVGAQGAPTVYALVDPACPACAEAINTLLPELQSGALQLRIIMAPLISRDSPGLIGGILSAEDPANMFLQHELTKANHQPSPVTPKDMNLLDPRLVKSVEGNTSFAFKYEIPGVPFFTWVEADGVKASSGVPHVKAFSNALVDSYNGNGATPKSPN